MNTHIDIMDFLAQRLVWPLSEKAMSDDQKNSFVLPKESDSKVEDYIRRVLYPTSS